MSSPKGPYTVLLQRDAHWRESNMMKIPNTDLAEQLAQLKALFVSLSAAFTRQGSHDGP